MAKQNKVNPKNKNGCWNSFVRKEAKDFKSLDLWRACLAEFLGTLLLVLYGVSAGLFPESTDPAQRPSSVHVALETGLFIAVIVATLWNVSGGHVNPAISIAFLLTRNITVIRFIVYVISQLIGAVAGAGIVKLMTSPTMQNGSFGVIEPVEDIQEYQAVLCEFFITFLLTFGVFSFIDAGRKDPQGSIPLMIGVLVSVNVFSAVST